MNDNAKIAVFCAAIFLVSFALVGFQVKDTISCESRGGIPVRTYDPPSFTKCVD